MLSPGAIKINKMCFPQLTEEQRFIKIIVIQSEGGKIEIHRGNYERRKQLILPESSHSFPFS